MRRINVMTIMAVASLLAISAIVPMRQALAAPQGSRWGANYFPNIALTTQDGKTVRFYDDLIKDKIVVINFIYTHCKDMCPLETARLAQVQKMLGDRVGKDIFFYSISIDPKADTAEVLKSYAAKYHAGPGWLFLTGKKEDIEQLSKKLGMFSDPNPNNRDGHSPTVLLGNESTGQWLRNAATDNPRFLATLVTNFMGDWTKHKAEAPRSYADAPTLTVTHKGQYLFATRCSACHTIGHGESVGPDLLGVTDSRTQAWLTRFIGTPDEMLDAKDATAMALFEKYKQVQMPNLRLGPDDIQYLIEYLKIQTAEQSTKSANHAPVPLNSKR